MNFSDRWLNKISGTDPNSGNDPSTVCETLRKLGVPYQERWDFGPDVDTVEKFYSNPPSKLFDYAKYDFLDQYIFKHEIVPPNEASIKGALRYSPLGVGVSAWFPDENGINHSKGMPNNHWCVLYGYDDEKRAWKIFDSYDGFKKLYSYDSEISIAKRFYISRKTAPLPQKLTLWQVIKSKWLKNVIM